MRASLKRLSSSSMKKKNQAQGEPGSDDIVAYDKAASNLIKGLERSLGKLDDKSDMMDASSSAGTEIVGELQELAAVLQKMSGFHQDLKKLSSDLRTALDNNTLNSLKTVQKGTLKDVLASLAAYRKSVESYNKDEKVHETRHTPETKAKLEASQELSAEKKRELRGKLDGALPECQLVFYDALRSYAEAYATFFGEGQKHVNSFSSSVSKIKSGSSSSSASQSGASASGMGVFGGELSALCELEGTQIPKFVDEGITMLESKGLGDRALFRPDQVPENAYAALRDGIENGSYNLRQANVLAVGACLAAYLRELPEPLLQFELYSNWLDAVNGLTASEQAQGLKAVAEKLPKCNFNVLRRLMGLLNAIARNASKTGLSRARLAAIWAPLLLRTKKVNPDIAEIEGGMGVVVVAHLLSLEGEIFGAASGGGSSSAGSSTAVPKISAPPPSQPAKPSPKSSSPAPPATDKPKPKLAPRGHPLSRNSAPLPKTGGRPPPSTAPKPGGVRVKKVAGGKKMPAGGRGVPPAGRGGKRPATKLPPKPSAGATPGGGGGGAPVKKAPPKSPRKSPRREKTPRKNDADSSDGLDSEEDSSGAFSTEEDEGMMHATGQDAEDMQSLGILGMMLSEEKRSSLSPALERKSNMW